MAVTAPYELLDLADGETRAFTVLGAERGTMELRVPLEPSPKVVPVLRLAVAPQDKPAGPPYYDVTSRTLQAQLAPLVDFAGALPRRLSITKIGVAPGARFTVVSAPAEVRGAL